MSLNVSYSQQQERREFVLMTGEHGMMMVNELIEKGNDKDFASFLVEKKVISKEERDRLISMIDASPDDYLVAKEVLRNLSEKELIKYHPTRTTLYIEQHPKME